MLSAWFYLFYAVPKKRLVVWSDEEEEGDSDGEGLHNQRCLQWM